jgi:hypothetical protein
VGNAPISHPKIRGGHFGDESRPRLGDAALASPGRSTRQSPRETVLGRSEHEFEPELNGPWNAHGAIPLPEARAGHIVVERSPSKAV